MKKVYSKPEIAFESFASNASIATCAQDTDLPSRDVCGIPAGTETLFNVGAIKNCTIEGDELTCYHNPSDDSRLFGS